VTRGWPLAFLFLFFLFGSTLLDRCLGRLPGVVALGETRWILDAGLGQWTHLAACGAHGSECSVFTPAVLAGLRADGEHGWWDRLSDLVGAEVLVSADKSPATWARLGLPDVLLVPYRSPESMLRSYETPGRWGTVAEGGAEIVRVWRWVRESGIRFVPIDTDTLADTLPAAVARLGLPWSPDVLEPWGHRGCVFGGNSARLQQFGRAFRPADSTPLPEHSAAVEAVRRARDELLDAAA